MKTWTIAIGSVLPPKTRQFNITTLPPIKYLSSDRTVTWSVHRMCSSSRFCTSQFQICARTNTHWVAIQTPQIWLTIGRNLTTTQWISVGSEIWTGKVKARWAVHNLHTDHVMIQSELKYLIAAKGVGTAKLELWASSCPVEQPRVYVWSR